MSAVTPAANTIYGGSAYEQILVRFLQGNVFTDNNLVHIRTFKEDKKEITRAELTNAIQDYKKTPLISYPSGANDFVGEMNLLTRYLEPQKYMVFLKYDPTEFEHVWRPWQSTGSLAFQDLNPTIKSTLTSLVLDQIQSDNGKMIIKGDKTGVAPYNKFNGLEVKLAEGLAAGDPITTVPTAFEIDNTSGKTPYDALKLTKSTIYESGKDKLIQEYEGPNWIWLADQTFVNDYKDQQSDRTVWGGFDPTAGGKAIYEGKPIYGVPGMSKNLLIGLRADSTVRSNIHLGIKDLQSLNDPILKSEPLFPFSEEYFLKLILSLDANYADPNTIAAFGLQPAGTGGIV